MDQIQHLNRAREIARANAANRRANTIFTLEYRGGGVTQIVGYKALCEALRIKPASLPVLLSKGGGTSFYLERRNPLTDEQDILTVTRTLPDKLLYMQKPKRGRPPGITKLVIQAERELAERHKAEERAKMRSRKK